MEIRKNYGNHQSISFCGVGMGESNWLSTKWINMDTGPYCYAREENIAKNKKATDATQGLHPNILPLKMGDR